MNATLKEGRWEVCAIWPKWDLSVVPVKCFQQNLTDSAAGT